jgi:hypothetical protein
MSDTQAGTHTQNIIIHMCARRCAVCAGWFVNNENVEIKVDTVWCGVWGGKLLSGALCWIQLWLLIVREFWVNFY